MIEIVGLFFGRFVFDGFTNIRLSGRVLYSEQVVSALRGWSHRLRRTWRSRRRVLDCAPGAEVWNHGLRADVVGLVGSPGRDWVSP